MKIFYNTYTTSTVHSVFWESSTEINLI
jgi:hypothetical protein